MENFNEKLNNILNENKPLAQNNNNNNFENFNNLLSLNLDKQYNKPWKELLKDCKIKIMNDYLDEHELNNSENFNLLKKNINNLKIEYDSTQMKIINIENIEIDNKFINIINKTKTYKKKLNNNLPNELSEDI
tara:strand:- start:129 stop:527 length:399 start_codon:yes stop_codon:yes gene_type:complete